MHVEIGHALSTKLRLLADKAAERLWVAVPYVGGWNAVRCVLGSRWLECDEVRFRLLTDTTNEGWLDRQSVEQMNSHGKIKHLRGLHAKIYIVDDHALVTSANLTERAFARRHEMGVFLSAAESKSVIKTFQDWWDKAVFPPDGWLKTLSKESHPQDGEEPGVNKLNKLYSLPPAPPDGQSISSPFRDYKRFMTSYSELADSYIAVGARLFPKAPLHIEVDMFLNYLFHEDGEPSKKFSTSSSPRNLTKTQKQLELTKQTRRFKKWAAKRGNAALSEIKKRTNNSSEIRKLLAKDHVNGIGWPDVRKVAKILHCMRRNRTRFLNSKNNSLARIKNEWEYLLHEPNAPMEVRMTRCFQRLLHFGPSAVQELPGWYDPKKYPIRNANSNAGLRFLGY
jgi:hypothetical protein